MFSFFKKNAAAPTLNIGNLDGPVLGMATGMVLASQEPSLPLLANERDDLNDFVAKLDAALVEVRKAADISKDVNGKAISLSNELANRGMWSQAKAVISGQNDKDLATMVERLGVSLQLTQSAVTVLFSVQGQKHRMLRQFHTALVNKISLVTADNATLDEAQKKAVLMFLDELQTQIDDQLEMQDTVDRNEKMLLRHEEVLEVFNEGLEQMNGDLTEISEAQAHISEEQRKALQQSEDLKKALNEQLQSTTKHLQERLQTAAEHLSQSQEKTATEIFEQHQKHQSSVELQFAQLQKQNEAQAQFIAELESQVKKFISAQPKLSRNNLLMSILCSVLVSVAVGAALWLLR